MSTGITAGHGASLVSVVLPTCRPNLVAAAVQRIARQTYRPMELIVLLHGLRRAALPEPAQRALADAGAKVLEFEAALILSDCLSTGTAVADGAIIAKVDDDDLYGPGYVQEAVDAVLAGKGDVVGKSEMYVHLAADRELLLWRPGASEREQDHVMGGTVAFRRELARSPGFSPGALLDMPCFLVRCRAAGCRIYATSRRHFLLRRLDGEHRHTWHPDHELFRQESILLRKGLDSDSPELLRLVS